MNQIEPDQTLLRLQQRFLHEVEQSVREANQAIIQEHMPELRTESFVNLAKLVARLRATYLKTALQLASGSAGETDETSLLDALPQQRLAFEEAVHAFDALQRAIKRGYVRLAADEIASP